MNVVLATSNPGKVREFKAMGLSMDVVTQTSLSIDSVEETGLTFVENALLKARHASQSSGLPALADDSGLVVPALNGEPGIYSSRYAGEGNSCDACIDLLLTNMRSLEGNDRQAYFYTCIVYLSSHEDPTPKICTGQWHGQIIFERRGSNGMGYDPIFYVPSHDCTAGEMELSVKNKISHRAQAMIELQKQLSAH